MKLLIILLFLFATFVKVCLVSTDMTKFFWHTNITTNTLSEAWSKVTELSLEKRDSNICYQEIEALIGGFWKSGSILKYVLNSGLDANQLGNYQGCLDEGGNYFLLSVNYPLPIIVNGFCLPSKCQLSDFHNITEPIAEIFRILTKFPIMPRQIIISNPKLSSEKRTSTIYYLHLGYALYGALIALCIFGTIYSQYTNSKRGILFKAINCFNIPSNLKALFYGNQSPDPNLNVLNGVRVLSMLWIIFSHLTMDILCSVIPVSNVIDMMTVMRSQRFYAFFPGAFLSVEIFFFLSGFLGILVCTQQLENNSTRKFLTSLMYYFHRYLRIMPLYAISIFTVLFIMPYIGSGPLYSDRWDLEIFCNKYWPLNLLFINNFVGETTNCLGWSWYLTNDFQMHLLIPILCAMHLKNKTMAFLTIVILGIGSVIIQFFILTYYGFRVSYWERFNPLILPKYYIKPYCRIIPFLIGVFSAWMYLSYRKNKAEKSLFNNINKWIISSALLRFAMYLTGSAIILCCVYHQFDYYTFNHKTTPLQNALYIIIARPAIVFGILLVIYPSFLGKGRVMQILLGNELFGFLSKLTFGAYLFNEIVANYFLITMEESFYFQPYKAILMTVDVFVVSCFISFLLANIVESPFTLLSKTFLKPEKLPALDKINKTN